MERSKAVHTAVSLLLLIFSVSGCHGATRPHVIFIVADDLGWNDVSWHNPQIISPNLDRLARNGVILNSSYVQPNCSPSRSCFMSGKYPYHTGFQNGIIPHLSPRGMPLSVTTLPQKLKEVGYSTHMVGKWHLGFCNWKYVPTFRGFDSFLGYYGGAEDYYTHTSGPGYDFRLNDKFYTFLNDKVYTFPRGSYSTNVFGQRAVDIINNHNPATPLFLYLPFQAVHAPLQVPKKYENMYAHIHNYKRRVFSGMVTAMDEAVGNITRALESTGLMENSVIIFTTDNGGPIVGGANNFPLRGEKKTLWEGGTKGSAFVYSKNFMKKTHYTNTEMIHAVDWFPTILHLAGGTPDPTIDGVNQWATVSEGAPSARNEFVYNINDIEHNAAIRVGKYKLIKGSAGRYNGWYRPPTKHSDLKMDTFQYNYRLYDIEADPTEHFDLASQLPQVVSMMRDRLENYRKSMVPAGDLPDDPAGNPKNFGGVWSPGWC
ncbi:arylsulfatase B-like [Liolophura sinensis]|uniref:arylsulfatase B-like n=1 Tax=Liolophura sinensis TaxID=3198878 RepID=UPI00315988F1